MAGLSHILLISALLLVLFALASVLLWRFCWFALFRWVERTRSQVQAERVQGIYRYQQQARAAAERLRQTPRITDPEGRKVMVGVDSIPVLRSRCCQELGIKVDSSWPEIRRHWRRSSLRWHPDQGGALDAWLRKLRAYEALKQLHALQNFDHPPPEG